MKTLKTGALGMTVILLLISIGNYLSIIDHGNVRTVEFLSVWAIGALSGLLIMQVVSMIKGSIKKSGKQDV